MGGQIDMLARDERAELLERDRVEARRAQQRHLLGEVGLRDAVGRIGGVAEVAALADPVVEEHGDTGARDGQRAPHRALLRAEVHRERQGDGRYVLRAASRQRDRRRQGSGERQRARGEGPGERHV
jgi:hypothetical protein